MSITRTTDTDDDGSGTTGTIRTNAWLQAIYDVLDARWSRATSTSTGTQTVISFSEADLVLFNNASDLTIRSLTAPASPAKPGKRLILASIGAGNVFLNHQDTTGTTAANRMINTVTSATTPLAAGAGKAAYVYDDNASRWRLVHHEQGAPLTPTFADSSYTGAGTDGNWALAGADVTTQTYYLVGKQLFVSWYLATTSVANTPATLRMTNAAWGGFTATKTKLRPCIYDDNGGGNTIGYAQVSAGGTEISIFKLAGGNFANATNTTNAFGDIDFEVT